jgi:ATPase subunit of ABC transporter with duplicated ATPase domains
VLQSVEATREEQQKLEHLRVRSAALAAQREVLAAASMIVDSMDRSIIDATSAVHELPSWPPIAGASDLLVEAREHVDTARRSLRTTHEAVRAAQKAVGRVHVDIEKERAEVDAEARDLRATLDSLHKGLGQITRDVDELREKVAQRDALMQQVAETRERLRIAAERRRTAFTDLEDLRSDRYRDRALVAEWLTTELHPHVRVGVRRSAARVGLTTALIELLTGSGLHYNRLAPQMSQSASALELVEKVEQQDAPGLADLVDIPLDRAHAVVSYLFERDLTPLLVAPVDDAADLWLLDGTDYKPAANLSIGQRCTTVLPILLRGKSDVLILDQPEDHLDNAFISGALVSTLKRRSMDAQFIFASHNANVPVLGEADRIIHMDSDGKRGFVRHQGPLDDPESVRAVTDVMEGGEDAFRRRAEFYASHSE